MIWNDRLKMLRDGSGVSLKEMAQLCGVSEATAQRYESGHIRQVPYEAVVAYADKFGCTPGYIMGWDDSPPPALRPDESSLLYDYNKLNVTGKNEASKRVRELTFIDDYVKKENPSALPEVG